MKNLIFILLLSLAACQKDEPVTPAPTTGTILFYSPDWQYRWSITIDEYVYGSVGQSSSQPNCTDKNFQRITLPAGKHTLEVFSLSGLASEPPVEVTWVAGGCSTYAIQ